MDPNLKNNRGRFQILILIWKFRGKPFLNQTIRKNRIRQPWFKYIKCYYIEDGKKKHNTILV